MAEAKTQVDEPREDKDLRDGPRPEPLYRWFSSVPQNWFALVVRGGDLYKIIHGVKGWYVDENFEFKNEDDEHPNIVSITRAIFGADFVGIPLIQGLFRYKFAWNKYWRKTDKDGKETPEYDVQVHDIENIIFTPFESQYPLTFGGIEVRAKGESDKKEEDFVPVTKTEEALIPVTIVITVRVRMIRPEIALMTNIDWLGGVLIPNLQKGIKNFAGEKTYDELIRGSKGKITSELVEYIMGTESDFKKDILEHAGVEIINIGVTDIRPNEDFEKALLNLAKAQRDALAVITTAEGAKRARELAGLGEEAYEAAIGRGRKAAFESLVGSIGRDKLADFIKWDSLRNSKVTTYAEGGSKIAGIIVGADGKPVS